MASAQITLKRKGKLVCRNSAKACCKIAIVRQVQQTAIQKQTGDVKNGGHIEGDPQDASAVEDRSVDFA